MPSLKYAIRQFRNSPGFTFAVIFALALGIGANTAIFSTVNAVLLDSRPFRSIKEPSRLMAIYERNPAVFAAVSERLRARPRNFREWKKQNHSFEGMAAYQSTNVDLTSTGGNGNREPERVESAAATADFFPLLGISVRAGRNFTSNEAQSASHLAILSDELWRNRFHADPRVLGKSIRASAAEYQIIGILPPEFELPATGQGLNQSKPKLWTPLQIKDDADIALTVYGRLKSGVSAAAADAEMKVIGRRLERAYPDTNRGWGVNVFPMISEDIDPAIRRSLYILQVAVGFVLLIACANVANLLLTKAVGREREIAIRIALGASRWQIAKQTLNESLVLSLLGGAAGLCLALGFLRLISLLAPQDSHGFHELRIDSAALAFTLGTSLAAGLLFGLAPAFYSMREGISQALNRGPRAGGGVSGRFRAALVIAEISLSLLLLTGAGLTIRSLRSVMNLDLGFQPDHLLTMSISLPARRYAKPEQVAAFNDRLLDRVRHLAGVRAVSLTTALPMRRIGESSYQLPGVPVDPNKPVVTDWATVTSEHVEAIGMRLLRGRNFKQEDVLAAQPSVALVNEAFARLNWPNQDTLGKVFLFGGDTGPNVKYTIAGIVTNEHQFGPESATHQQIYLPGHHMTEMFMVVRSTGDPLALANTVKQQVWAIDKDQPVSKVESMDNIFYEWTAPRRFSTTVLINFAIIALVLAAVGLYSVLAYSVSLRTREIGVRMALGAEPKNVAGLILLQGLRLALIGIAIGLAGAFALARFLESVVFGVSALDPFTLASVSALLIAIAAAASYLPARRAARVDPIEALRAE